MTLFTRLCVALGSLLAGGASTSASAAQPNVVLILSDDQHWGDYAFMGHEHLQTPALERLASESLVFTRGYVPSSLCCPSLASLITGRYPHEHLVVGNDPPDSPKAPRGSPAGKAAFEAGRERMTRHLEAWPTLPRLLGEHGYRSLQTGKWWQGNFKRGGFDEGMTKGQRHGDEGLAIGRKTMEPVYDFMKRCRADEKPFFVWYAPLLPHDPHDPPAELVEHYQSKTDSIHVARYWGNVERFDTTVGELMNFLDTEKLSADTLVIYVTDNGWIQSTDKPRFAARSKLSPYDGGLRTPIMLRQPGTIAPATSEALASSLDIMPTMLAACGVPAPEGLPGLNLLDAEKVAARKQLFGECYTHTIIDLDDPSKSLLWRWAVRRDGDHLWKLIEPVTARGKGGFPKWEARLVMPEDQARYERGKIELFDVAADPHETKNLAEANPVIVKDLQASLDAWWDFREGNQRPAPLASHTAPVSGWPNWRGAGLDGVAAGDGYVTAWAGSVDGGDAAKNVIWRVALPGLGGSTPAVWGDSIVLTCGVEGKDAAICFDRHGKERWRRLLGAERPGKHKKATGANPSPVTDGEHVWVYFKSGELACLKLTDGTVIWKTNLQEQFGKDTLWWDLGTSPVLSKKAVIIAVMQEGPSYLVAFDRVTGKVLWKQDRMLEAPLEATQSYTTPLVLAGDTAKGEPAEMLVVLGADHVTAHDAADGSELWRVGGLNPAANGYFRSIASPVASGDLIIAPYARGDTVTAIRRGGKGDVTASHVAWERKDVGSDVPTPAAIDGHIVISSDKGRVVGLDAATGKTTWEKELPKNRNAFSSSPIVVAGHVIVTREDGASWVLALPLAGEGEPKIVGTGSVDEMTVATPVCVDGRIYLRTHDSLWCIGSR